jgi:hypothetical protein
MVNATTRYRPVAVLPKLPSALPFDGSRGDDDAFAAGHLFDFERRDSVAHDVTHFGVVPIEAPIWSSTF